MSGNTPVSVSDPLDREWRFTHYACIHCKDRPSFDNNCRYCTVRCCVLWHEERRLPLPLCNEDRCQEVVIPGTGSKCTRHSWMGPQGGSITKAGCQSGQGENKLAVTPVTRAVPITQEPASQPVSSLITKRKDPPVLNRSALDREEQKTAAQIDPCRAGTRPSASALPMIETPKKKKSEYIPSFKAIGDRADRLSVRRLPPPSNEIILRSSPEQKDGQKVGVICDPASPSPLARLVFTSPAHNMNLTGLSVTPSLDQVQSTASVDASFDQLLEGLKQHQTDLSTSLFDTREALMASRTALAASESARKETEEKLAAATTERDQAIMERNQAVAERHRAVAERLQAIANEEMKRAKKPFTMEELARMLK